MTHQDELIPVVGEYDDLGAQTFSIFFTSCDTLFYANCKSVDEVSEWLKQKYVLVLYTERRFSHESGEAVESSKLARIPINGVSNTHYKFQLEATHLLDLDPGLMPFSASSKQDFYMVNRLPDQPLFDDRPLDPSMEYYPSRFKISFEVSPFQKEVHVLPTFNYIETIAVAGGLAFALFLIGSVTVGLCSRFALELFLVNEMYQAQAKEM